MQQILFASSNKYKIMQFQYVAGACGLKVKIVSAYEQFPGVMPYDEEYQTQFEIVEKGAHEVYAQTKQPIIVEDTILEIEALNGRPGLYANDYLKSKGMPGMLEEMRGKSNRKAIVTSIAGYYDGKLFISSKNAVEGHIAEKISYKKGEPTWVGPTEIPTGGGFNAVFIIDATGKTIADHTAKEGLTLGYREPNFKVMLNLLTK